jgi:hypothetical protein
MRVKGFGPEWRGSGICGGMLALLACPLLSKKADSGRPHFFHHPAGEFHVARIETDDIRAILIGAEHSGQRQCRLSGRLSDSR